MSNAKNRDVIDEAVKFLRDYYHAEGRDIQSAHAHAAVSHYLGYKSKAALKSDPSFDPTDVDLLNYRETGIEKLVECISRMKPTPLQDVSPSHLGEVIHAGLAPACESCNHKSMDITPLGYEEREPEGWVCRDCATMYEDDYATCRYCGEDYIYRASEINERGECHEHDGESVYDEEEEDDIDSLIEYYQNH
ncbi:hypothetical protein HFV04_003400 [Pseudomonas sp. BIGb0427]|uniref:hypothetical protein n=1 Tax=Pseudomonas sp. BIGb0427 TaxID=2724470 RepID=UPI0018A74CEB|nr:hypothetical protein [Pseudomonas sp. BIGb0427]QPG63832.1 hypothetical protein HFV04_003400 [Pseudomonas sp. BIGb0427]